MCGVPVLCSVPDLQSWSHFVMLQEDWVTQSSKQRKPRDATLSNSFVKNELKDLKLSYMYPATEAEAK